MPDGDDDGPDEDGLLRVRDLLDADEASVQRAVRSIDWSDLVAVLSAEPEAVVHRMCDGMGGRSGEMLLADIALGVGALAPQIPAAERRIDAILRELASSGRLSVPRLGVLSYAEMDRLLDESDGGFEAEFGADPDLPAG